MDKFRQEQSTNRHTKKIQNNHHRRTVSIQKLHFILCHQRHQGQRRQGNTLLKISRLQNKKYLRKHKGMNILLQTFSNFKSKKTNEIVRRKIRNRRYEITNEGEIRNVLNQMESDV